MLIQRFVLNELATNTFVVGVPEGEVFILDPGSEVMTQVIRYVEENHLTVKWVINTHSHFDHIAGNTHICEWFNVPLLMHEADLPGLSWAPEFAEKYFGKAFSVRQPDGYLRDGDILTVKPYEFRVLATPGHSPGCICLYEERQKVLFTGDTLFAGTVGRTDVRGGDAGILMESLRDKLWPLPDETRIFPGHEDDSTIGEERMYNPFFFFSS